MLTFSLGVVTPQVLVSSLYSRVPHRHCLFILCLFLTPFPAYFCPILLPNLAILWISGLPFSLYLLDDFWSLNLLPFPFLFTHNTFILRTGSSVTSYLLCVLSDLSHVWLSVTLWNTGAGCLAPLQGIFLTQGLNPRLFRLLHWQMGSLPLVPPRKLLWGFPNLTMVKIARRAY